MSPDDLQVGVAEETRRYDSTLRRRRAEETRRAVIDAATALFAERGWSVGVRDIAGSAGVSVETVYANFGSKAELLSRVLDIAVVGDDEPVALSARPAFAALGKGDRARRARAGAELNTAINLRTIGVQRTLREAAAAEPGLALRLQEARDRQRLDVHVAGAMIAGRALSEAEGDGLWAVLSMEVYELLTGSAGWTTGEYANWLTGAISNLLDLED